MPVPSQSRALNLAAIGIVIALTVIMLVVGQQLLQPLVIAIVFWFLINVIASRFLKVQIGPFHLYRPISFLLSSNGRIDTPET